MPTLRILHISDFHGLGAGDRKRAYKRARVLGDAWRHNLDELAGDGRAFDLVALTGDTAANGLAEEYAAATPFIMNTLERLGVPSERFFLVPGNHDVHRLTEPDAWAELRAGIHHYPGAVSEWLADSGPVPFRFEPTWRDAVLQREQPFWTWVERDLGRSALQPAHSLHGRLGYSVDVPGLGVPVRLIGLDSAWLAGDDRDAGRLWLTEDQLGILCHDPDGTPWPGFRLALVHHPLSHLADGRVATRELGKTVDLLLRGHQRAPVACELAEPGRSMRELAAGCLYAGMDSTARLYGCHVIDAVLDEAGRPLCYQIRFRAWSPHTHQWHDDSSLYHEARDGRLTWTISGSMAESAFTGPVRSAPTELRLRYIEAIEQTAGARRTLTALTASASASGGVVPLDAVYVPPHLHVTAASDDASALDQEAAGDLEESGGALEDWLRVISRDRKLVTVLGEMGRGKTELLHHVRRALAVAAREDLAAPLPILVRARDLGTGVVDRQDLGRAAGAQLAMQSDTLRELLADPSTRWIYLIDGLDEAAPAIRETILALARDPAWRATRIIVASRPSGVRLEAGEVLLSLPPWSSDEVERFLERWHAIDAPTVEALRTSPHYQHASSALLANPLMATLCLALVRQNGSLPLNRAALFMDVIDILAQGWAAGRAGNSIEWKDVAPALEQAALQHLREGHPHITRDRLKKALHRVAPHDALKLEDASERCFGVLVRVEDGSGYDFLFRGLAEHLAGAAFLEDFLQNGFEAIQEAVYEPWAEEVVRHAIGIAMERGRHQAALTLLRSLALIGLPWRQPADQWLRPLLIAIRTAADVEKPTGPVAKVLVMATLRGLLEEDSHWVGDRVADAVQMLAATGGPITKVLWRYCHKRLMESEHAPEAWYAAQGERDAAWWLRALRHRDPEVRAVACERLADYVNDPEVREHLVLMLFDGWGLGVAPALLAGATLRKATRDAHFVEEIRDTLVELLEAGGQFSAGGAALALQPDEADPRLLARALAMAYQGTREILAEPVHALAATPGGREALEAEWPQWREGLVETWQYRARLPELPESVRNASLPPFSHQVHRRIVRAFATGLMHLDPAEWRLAQARHMDGSIDELCRAAFHRPGEALRHLRLNEYHGTIIPVGAQRDLGRAAIRHREMRDALLAAWHENALARRVIGTYPGVALERLVLGEDKEAIEVYAAWLPVSPYTWPFDFPRPDPAVFTIARIKQAALADARHAWDHATNGQVRDGERSWLAPQTTAIILHHRGPAWLDDAALVSGLCQWLDAQDEQKRLAAVWAFVGGPVPAEVRPRVERVLVELIRGHIDAPTSSAYEVKRCLRAAERLGISEMRSLLETMSGLGTAASALAAAMLIPILTASEACALSGRIAAAGIVAGDHVLGARQLRVLVQAAPEAWLALVKRNLDEFRDPALALRLLPHLPDARRIELARLLHQADVESDLPWTEVSDGGRALVYARPADVVARVLFEAGLLIEDDPLDPDEPTDS
jgi:hypothetical protein